MRRNIPLESLRIFESAARHLSFTMAATELGLTQGAVSQRIQNLEAKLDVALFRRLPRTLALTVQGEILARAVSRGLEEISKGLELIEYDKREHQSATRLTVTNSVTTCWLLQRLERMTEETGGAQIMLLVDDRMMELGVEADMGLRFGSGRYPGLKTMLLSEESVFPVCSPGFLASHPTSHSFGDPNRIREWEGLPLLVDAVAEKDGSGCGWGDWFSHLGLAWNGRSVAAFNYAHLAQQAAIEGHGIALACQVLAADNIASGKLVRVGVGPMLPARFAYYLVSAAELSAPGRRIAAWLAREMKLAHGSDRLRG
jgi:LysR family glycine cleavage system transcriptional activator